MHLNRPKRRLAAKHYQIEKMKKYYSYRVNKYISPLPGNNEWISFYDIGSLVTEEDYLYTENEFIKLFKDVSALFDIRDYKITDLENYKKLDYHNGDKIQCIYIEPLLRDILRERLWCKLRSNKLEFHFGYDYYMYIVSYDFPISMSDINTHLIVEEFDSPYMN